MNKSKISLTCIGFTLLVALFLLAMATGFLGLLIVKEEVETAFGKPHHSLSYTQSLYFQIVLYAQKEALSTPVNPAAQAQPFLISSNEPTHLIFERLVQQGLIVDTSSMQILMQYLGYDTQILAGEHLLSAAMSPYQIAKALTDPTNLLIQFNLLAGWRNEEVAAALAASGLDFTAQEFFTAANQPLHSYLPHRSYSDKINSLQGFLMPGSYRIQKTASPTDLLHLFTQNFDSRFTPELEQKIEDKGLTSYEGIILASIVQREGVLEEEMPLIASVFINRLRNQMKLDSDPTVQFALGYNDTQKTWWTNPLNTADFAIDSPYNTYLYSGLPPTPICNPSLAAIMAVAEAPQSDYFYFRAACDGSGRHIFSKTYAEHLDNACP